MLQLPSLPTCLGAGRLPGACVVVTQGLTGVQARPPADSLNPCSLEQPGGARPRAWAWLPVLVTLRGQRRPAGLAGHRGRPSVPREILHGTAPPGHRGRPGWLAPLSGAQGLGTGPLLTLHPGLNISERLSVQVRGGRGQSPTSTSGSSGTGSHRLDNACGGVCGRLDLWSRTSLCYRGQDRDVGRWLGLGPPAQMPADGAEHLEGRAWTGPRPELDRGALGLALGHPFDTVKVRLQTQTTYRGIVDCVVKTYRHESIPGFFKGMSFPLASVAVVNSVLFGVYSNALLVLTATSHQERRVQPPSYTHVFVAGCTGGFLQGASPETWHLRPPTGRNAGVPGPARPGPPASSPALREVEQITGGGGSESWGGTLWLVLHGDRLCTELALGWLRLTPSNSSTPRSPGLRSPPPRRGCQVALPAFCLAPFDLIKVRLQNQTEPRAQPGSRPPRYRGPVHCAASIFQEEGPRGLFRGAWALMLRDTPTLGFYFVTYEWLCRRFTPDGRNPSIASWVTATPLDVIKSRMQMDGVKQREYRGMLDCAVASARREGLGVFFRGLTINSARAFPVNAVTFLSYEYLLHLWG
ncbi:solute carrier family 25 member 45 isoform 4-T6 [Glossophaga mutica]